MTIFELSNTAIRRAAPASFAELGITERVDLQRLLRSQVDAIAPDTFVVAEEFSQWEDSARRIDLLAIDRAANLVVIELKRTADGGHMELQALRYAAMISTMTFAQVVEAHRKFRADNSLEGDATEAILAFLGWAEADDDQFAQDVRIVLAAEGFSREITTAVMWLNDHSLDIRCVRMKPHRLGDQVLLDVQQVIPLPEAAEYQVRIREKSEVARGARSGNRWDEPSFMAALETRKGSVARATAEAILHWAEDVFGRTSWGTGVNDGSFTATAATGRDSCSLFVIYTYGRLEIEFQSLAARMPFADPALREELRERLNHIPGVSIPPDATTRRPSILLEALAPSESRQLLTDAFEWVLATIRNGPMGDRPTSGSIGAANA